MGKRILTVLAVLAFLAGTVPFPAWALDQGTYIVNNTTYYVNPDTGISNDGGETSTGEAMCRNAVFPETRYEYTDGKHYVTVRLKLSSFLDKVTFQEQKIKGSSDSYQKVSHTVVGENKEENTKDYRFEVSSPDLLIHPSFYVEPMSRDVAFFLSIDLHTGKEDQGQFAEFNQIQIDSSVSHEVVQQVSNVNSEKAKDETEPKKAETVEEIEQDMALKADMVSIEFEESVIDEVGDGSKEEIKNKSTEDEGGEDSPAAVAQEKNQRTPLLAVIFSGGLIATVWLVRKRRGVKK